LKVLAGAGLPSGQILIVLGEDRRGWRGAAAAAGALSIPVARQQGIAQSFRFSILETCRTLRL